MASRRGEESCSRRRHELGRSVVDEIRAGQRGDGRRAGGGRWPGGRGCARSLATRRHGESVRAADPAALQPFTPAGTGRKMRAGHAGDSTPPPTPSEGGRGGIRQMDRPGRPRDPGQDAACRARPRRLQEERSSLPLAGSAAGSRRRRAARLSWSACARSPPPDRVTILTDRAPRHARTGSRLERRRCHRSLPDARITGWSRCPIGKWREGMAQERPSCALRRDRPTSVETEAAARAGSRLRAASIKTPPRPPRMAQGLAERVPAPLSHTREAMRVFDCW